MKNMKLTGFITFICFSISYNVQACKKELNTSTVTSLKGLGVYYAKSIPDSLSGVQGTTEIYKVKPDIDELIYTYDWYSLNGITLSWSPLGGLGVLRLNIFDFKNPLSFYMDGVHLKTYSSEELVVMGAKKRYSTCGWHFDINFVKIGYDLSNTNNRFYILDFKHDNVKHFNLINGQLIDK